jgi:hypothetical protein
METSDQGSMDDSSEIHPVSPAVRARVLSELLRIESTHDVRVLYACESGSRGWGFASPDSDYDVRFVYVHRPQWYLSVHPGREVIERPIDDELDVSGWELRKLLRLAHGGNAVPAEWLDSPIVYRAQTPFTAELRSTLDHVYRPERGFHHYLHMAAKNYREHLKGERIRLKKYFYVLRPILAADWILESTGRPPMRFEALLDGLLPAGGVRDAIDELLRVKRAAAESKYGPRVDVLNEFIETRLESLSDRLPPPVSRSGTDALDTVLFRAVMSP